MFTGKPAIVAAFDAYWQADSGVVLNGNRVGRWTAVDSDYFIDQPEMLLQPVYQANSINFMPSLRFQGLQHMAFANLWHETGPHHFFFVVKPEAGRLLDCQRGPCSVDTRGLKKCWQVLEVTFDKSKPLTGTLMLGADHFGIWHYFRGNLAAFGYKKGPMTAASRKYIHSALLSQYAIEETACESWSTRLLKPLQKLFKR